MAIVKKRRRKNTKLVDWIKQQDQEPKQQQYTDRCALRLWRFMEYFPHENVFNAIYYRRMCVHPIVCICVKVSTWLDSNALLYTHTGYRHYMGKIFDFTCFNVAESACFISESSYDPVFVFHSRPSPSFLLFL